LKTGESGCDFVWSVVRVYESAHPVYASLDHPLFACGGKRVEKFIIKLLFF
jgi:hypothetical protein